MEDQALHESERRMFRRSSWKWMLAGALCVMAATVYMGTDASELLRKALGHRAAMAVWYGLALSGGLLLLVGGLLFGEHVTIDEAAVEQFRWGRPRLRMLWINLERVTLYKSPKRIKGPVELWGAGRSLRIDPGYMRYDQLEAEILDRAAALGAEVRNLREPRSG